MSDGFRYKLETLFGQLCQKQLPKELPDFAAARKKWEKSRFYGLLVKLFFFMALLSLVCIAVPIASYVPMGFTSFSVQMMLVGITGLVVAWWPLRKTLLMKHEFLSAAEAMGWKTFSQALSLFYEAAKLDDSVICQILSSPEALASRIEERIRRHVKVILELQSKQAPESVLEEDVARDERAALRHLTRLAAALGLMGTDEYAFMIESGGDDTRTNIRARILYRELFKEAQRTESDAVAA